MCLHYPLIRDFVDRTVTTLHGRLDLPEVRRLYSVFSGAPVVSISMRPAQAHAAGELGWNGLSRPAARPAAVQSGAAGADTSRSSAGFLRKSGPTGRSRSQPAPAHALKIAAKVDRVDQEYWEERIKPMVDANPNVEFIGEIDERQKAQFLGDAEGAAVPDRLARAVRHGDDRVDGLRDAGGRLPSRLRRRKSSTMASPDSSSTPSTRRSGPSAGSAASIAERRGRPSKRDSRSSASRAIIWRSIKLCRASGRCRAAWPAASGATPTGPRSDEKPERYGERETRSLLTGAETRSRLAGARDAPPSGRQIALSAACNSGLTRRHDLTAPRRSRTSTTTRRSERRKRDVGDRAGDRQALQDDRVEEGGQDRLGKRDPRPGRVETSAPGTTG